MGTGGISAERALNYGFTGPNLRAAGVDYDVRVAQPPRVDGHRLLHDVLQPERSQLLGDERGGGALLGSPCHPEAERMGAE